MYYKKSGFFPYHYCDSFEKCNESLPSKDKSYNILTNQQIGYEDYEQQVVMIKVSRMKTTLDYLGLYLKRDVLLFICE